MNNQQCECGSQAQDNFCSKCGAALKPDIFRLIKKGKTEEFKQALNDWSYDLEAKGLRGWTALILAAETGRTECLSLLLDNKAKVENKALLEAARSGHKDCIQLLLQHGVDPNAKSRFGDTALIMASIFGHKDCLRVLLKNNADPNIKDGEGDTALSIVADGGYGGCLRRILLKHNADPNIINDNGDTALIQAAYRGNEDSLKLLLEYGATVSPETKRKYPEYADLWSKDKLSLTDLLTAVENIQQQLTSLEAQIKQMQ